eukprot:Cvel_4226.t1-p1 / transcript=Cvel_4226.t1 / gene=Cvel_4226 / organism=Chromera_velia_CCMP2878 / gene_product=hypothetical protein / transcript_product=hypothetical protein / location=Cvel_scaffold183:4809-5300(-) / protein_length=164 / sequence_SO=supercontig / SO=protein_coding / is_pseudo=false
MTSVKYLEESLKAYVEEIDRHAFFMSSGEDVADIEVVPEKDPTEIEVETALDREAELAIQENLHLKKKEDGAVAAVELDEKMSGPLKQYLDAFDKIGETESQEEAVELLLRFTETEQSVLKDKGGGSHEGERAGQSHFGRWISPLKSLAPSNSNNPPPPLIPIH